MAFARPYSQAERELALAKLNATKPQLPVAPMPTPGPGQYNAAAMPGMLASGPAENPLTGGLDQRMGAMQSQLRSLLAQQQFAQAQQGNNYQALQSILAQPGPQMQLPDRQYPSAEGQAASGALQFLAALAGARPQYIQPMQAVQAQQQQNRDQMYQDEYMRRQLQYNAEAQARQAQERAASLKIKQTDDELRSIGMLLPKTEAELNDLAMKQADIEDKQKRADLAVKARERQQKMRIASQETMKWMGTKAGQYAQALDFVSGEHPDWTDEQIEAEARTISGVSLQEAREAQYLAKTATEDQTREAKVAKAKADADKAKLDVEYLPQKYKAQIESLRAAAEKSRSSGGVRGKAGGSGGLTSAQTVQLRSKLLTSAEKDLADAQKREAKARDRYMKADAFMKDHPKDPYAAQDRADARNAHDNAVIDLVKAESDRDVVKRELADMAAPSRNVAPAALSGEINGAMLGVRK